MTQNGVLFEEGEFGVKAVLTSPWSFDAHEEIKRIRPNELELNTSKGWYGDHINFITDFDWLKSFSIIDMKISNIEPIHNLCNLTSLNIVTYCKTGIRFASFPFLRDCSLEWRKGAESLFDCITITHLFLNRYKGKSSAPFGKLVNLVSLTILNSTITELHGLDNLRCLRSVRLGGLRLLNTLQGVEKLSLLENLEIQTCRSIRSLAPLSNLQSLTKLNLSNDGELDSLAPLRHLPKLHTMLFYESTNIVDGDLRPIFANPAIYKVSFQNRRHYSHKREDFHHRDQG